MDFTQLFTKKLLLVTGKGGVGKTLLTAALGSEAALCGKKVCLVECAGEDQLGPLLGIGKVGHRVAKVRENLFVTNLDPELNFRDFIVLHLGFSTLFDKIFSKSIVKSFVRMIPGISEITLLGRLYYYGMIEKDYHFDLVILDGFSSGHFLSLLSTPDAILNSGFVGPIIKETRAVKDYIFNDETTGVILINTPEPLVLSETIDFLERFRQISSSPPLALFINRNINSIRAHHNNSEIDQLLVDLSDRSNKIQNDLKNFFLDLRNQNLKDTALYLLPEQFIQEEPLTAASARNWLTKGKECQI